jgi:hypothetical protein
VLIPCGRVCYRASMPCRSGRCRPARPCGKSDGNRTAASPGRWWEPHGLITRAVPQSLCAGCYRAATPCGRACDRAGTACGIIYYRVFLPYGRGGHRAGTACGKCTAHRTVLLPGKPAWAPQPTKYRVLLPCRRARCRAATPCGRAAHRALTACGTVRYRVTTARGGLGHRAAIPVGGKCGGTAQSRYPGGSYGYCN